MTNPSENSHDRADKVCDLYFREGLNSAQIGQTLGLHRHSVINIIHRRGLKPRTAQESLRLRLGQKMPEVSDDLLRHRYKDEKLPLKDIAAELGASAGWVTDRLDAMGETRRTPQEGRWARLERLNPVTNADELRDPAYEARQGIANRLYCKICGVPVKDLTSHLRTRHRLTSKEYWKIFPGARVTTFAQVARQQRCDVKELMARFANDYLTRSELRECVLDPKWEDLNYTPGSEPSLPDFAACRLCGLKCKGHLGRHLKNEHDMSLQDYRSKYPGAPTCSRAWTASGTERLRKIVGLAKDQLKFKPNARGLAPLTKARIELAACLKAEGLSERAMTNELNPGSKPFESRRSALKTFWKDHRDRVELEKLRIAALSKAERDVIANDARAAIKIQLQSRRRRKH